MDTKEKFLKVFNNLPINLREEVILVLPDIGNISWKVAFLEVNANTELGARILKKLAELKII